MAINRIAYFFAGAVLGAAGMAMVKSGKGKELVTGVITGGSGLVENTLARVETIKEDIEDYVAEVKYKAEQAKETAKQEPAEPTDEAVGPAEEVLVAAEDVSDEPVEDECCDQEAESGERSEK